MNAALLAVTLLVSTVFPSNSKTSWMRLEAFRLTIGMTRYDAMSAVSTWKPKKGANDDQLTIDYAGDKAITMEFRKDRLHAVRFELFEFLPEIRKAFEEQRGYLRETLGAPRKTLPSALIYDNVLPNAMVVVTDDPKSEQGKRGIGILAVRYYDPR